MTPRLRSATLGLLVAASLSGYLIVRVIQASAPAPTSVHMTNLGPLAVTVTGLRIRGESVLEGILTLPASPTSDAPPEGRSSTINISAGLPIEVQARVDRSPSPLACTLESRPQGVCIIRARLTGSLELRCDYDCQTEVSR